MDRLPQRKSPRLPRYDYNQAGVYFVTFCTKARENLLARITSSECVGTHHDASVLTLTDIGQVVNRMVQVLPLRYPAIHLESYVIMPNHVHLLLRIVSEERTLREASLRNIDRYKERRYPHAGDHPHDAAISGHQGPEPGFDFVFPAGGFLRDVQRGRPAGVQRAGPDPDHPGPKQAAGGAHPHVRGALPLLRQLHCPAHRQGLQGSHLRADGGPGPGQGAGGPGHHPGGDAGDGDRLLHAGGRQKQLHLRRLRRFGGLRPLPVRHLHRRGLRRLLPRRGGGAGPSAKRAGPVPPRRVGAVLGGLEHRGAGPLSKGAAELSV